MHNKAIIGTFAATLRFGVASPLYPKTTLQPKRKRQRRYMKYRLRLILIFIFILFIQSCASNPTTIIDRHNFVGVWELQFDGKYPFWFSQLAFTSDGRKCVLSYNFNSNGDVSITYYLNKYKIQNGYIETTIGKTSSLSTPTGVIMKDKILKVSANSFDVIMEYPFQNNIVEKHQRLTNHNPEHICKIATNYFK